jgi:hypothetical protein
MDAMEFVFPEDWPSSWQPVSRPQAGRYLYFTVELAAEEEIENGYAAGLRLGCPWSMASRRTYPAIITIPR